MVTYAYSMSSFGYPYKCTYVIYSEEIIETSITLYG